MSLRSLLDRSLASRAPWRPGAALFAGLAVALFVSEWAEYTFYVKLISRALILGLAALAVDLVVGVAGLVSLGHAAFLGVGAYAVAILAEHGITNSVVQWSVGILASATVALVVGALSLRTSGVYFIMITLAFAQMLYFIANSVSRYGGNDGLTIWAPTSFPGFGSLGSHYRLAWVCYTILLIAYLALLRVRDSRFGRVLRAAKENERRMLALGFAVHRYRLAAFVMSGAVTGLAGVLLATMTEFVAPAYMSWHRSGELLAMVVLGGLATLHGAVVGALLFVVLEEILSTLTTYWGLPFGLFLVLAVLTGRGKLLLRAVHREQVR